MSAVELSYVRAKVVQAVNEQRVSTPVDVVDTMPNLGKLIASTHVEY